MTEWLVIDLEATCDEPPERIPPDEQEVIEIGAVLANDETPYFDWPTFQTYITPILRPTLTPFCTALTGITQEQVDAAPLFPEAMHSLLEWSGEQSAWYSWGKSDLGWINMECVRRHEDKPLGHHVDVSKLFREITGRRAHHRKALKIAGLEPFGEVHRGRDDAVNVARLLLWCHDAPRDKEQP